MKDIHKRKAKAAVAAALAVTPFLLASCGSVSDSNREAVDIPPAPIAEEIGAPPPSADGIARDASEDIPSINYVVQSGDTLSTIASRHGVSVSSVTAANNIADINKIRAGDTLRLPGATAPAPETTPAPETAPAPETTPAPTPAPAPETTPAPTPAPPVPAPAPAPEEN